MKLGSRIGIAMIATGFLLLAYLLFFTPLGINILKFFRDDIDIGHGGGVIAVIGILLPIGAFILVGFYLLDKEIIVLEKYDTLGHWLASIGMIILIVILILFLVDFLWLLGHIFLLLGILGIYFSKTKNIGSVKKSVEKEGTGQTSLTQGIVNILRQDYLYVFFVIIVVGLICHLLQILGMAGYSIYSIKYISALIGYSFLLGGLLLLYDKKTGFFANYLKKKRQKQIK
ncbi:MAG: hypothetical protein ACTSQU_04555 [Promethearchaeota archaeon]